MSPFPADRSRPVLPQAVRRPLPARPVLGFAVLLVALFALSYAVGTVAGPVAPGLRPADGVRTADSEPMGDGDMGGMHGMGGTR
ncbi:hypothetical protein [Streptomyces halobius]|uniref:Uncharacterized protein n=1 Tax=Streptomyces halobius TaxID=2879846 RepID=A0ABY4MH45_9ACTN|nr:hypothetical protein [Streptomyces halobius]UQA96990.1 hypothetical protein K9S39_38560 [Streptomyces halobius]